MESETPFRIILPLLLIAFIAHRGYYTKKYREADGDTLKKRDEGPATKVAGLLGMIGFIAMLVYIFQPNWLSFASLPLPLWIRWVGVGISLSGFALLQWAQTTLGKNWSDTPRMMREQTLVTSGPYRWIRHPIYTAFLLILSSTFFVSANWLIGISWTGMTILEIAARIHFEESLMIEYFGDQYNTYMKKTGRLLPRLIR
jgi:protein-S-isoprenylcysteine O-methyltransferase Ste14